MLESNFILKCILGLKRFWVQKIVGSKKNVSSEIFLCPTKFWVHKFFGSDSNVESEKNIGFTKMSGQKKFEPKKFWVQKILTGPVWFNQCLKMLTNSSKC